MDEVKLNSKGKPYRKGPPTTEQLEKLKNMRLKATASLQAKGKQTISEKEIYKAEREARPTKHMIEKKERVEMINEIVEEKKIKKPVKKPVKEESSDEDEPEIIIKRKEKKEEDCI